MISPAEKLQTLISTADWTSLYERFNHMSNAEFRRVEQVLRQSVLPGLTNAQFWDAYLHLLQYRRQAFLSAILAIHHLAQSGQLDCTCDEALAVARWFHADAPDSVVKVVRMALPLLTSSTQIYEFLHLFDYTDNREIAAILLKENTPHAYYSLFQHLKHEADNPPLLRSACTTLLRKGDDLSFNMASILRSYFDITDINSTLSLQIEPYELSYIDQSFDNFVHVLRGKRPKML